MFCPVTAVFRIAATTVPAVDNSLQPWHSRGRLLLTSLSQRVRDVLSSGERESQLVGESGTVWGTALVPREEGKGCAVTNPVFVSVGHRVSLETGVALTKAVGRYRA